jgi:hypothetical protein
MTLVTVVTMELGDRRDSDGRETVETVVAVELGDRRDSGGGHSGARDSGDSGDSREWRHL